MRTPRSRRHPSRIQTHSVPSSQTVPSPFPKRSPAGPRGQSSLSSGRSSTPRKLAICELYSTEMQTPALGTRNRTIPLAPPSPIVAGIPLRIDPPPQLPCHCDSERCNGLFCAIGEGHSSSPFGVREPSFGVIAFCYREDFVVKTALTYTRSSHRKDCFLYISKQHCDYSLPLRMTVEDGVSFRCMITQRNGADSL